MRSSFSLLTLVSLAGAAVGGPVSELRERGPLAALRAPSQGAEPEFSREGKNGAVACEVDVCSNVGVGLLKKGGSAADAVIGAALCVGSINAFHSGIGGGGFMLVRGSKGSYEMIDFRETMPAAGNETMYSSHGSNQTLSTVGGLAVGVPGELRGWEALHKRHGKLPWAELFEPAIKLNREGFKIPHELANAIKEYETGFICQDPYWADIYCANGTGKKEGELVKRLRYAKTLETLSKEGPDAFYHGEIALNTAAAAYARGGILTTADLANYSVVIREPNNITYKGSRRIFSTVAPSSGNVVLSALNTIGQYDDEVGSNLTTHRLIEATKFAYAERAEYGDPDFVKNVSALEKSYISDQSARKKRDLIKDNTTEPLSYYDPELYTILSDHGTSQLVAVDSSGMAITLTTTVNLYWGSQVMTSDGIVLNDEMDDFSSPNQSNAFGYVATPNNFIRPGKRPLSSISPTIVEDLDTGVLELAVGSAGGSRIITANIQNTHNVISSNGTINAQQSLAMARWHDQLEPLTTSFEYSDPSIGFVGYDNSTVAYLHGLGHNVSFVAPGSSTAQAIQRFSNGTLLAATEVRQVAARGAAY